MKVYEKQHLKAWAQEIVVLGMLRKAQHPSLLQCLWTGSSNPYYDTMTLITGEVINSDSRYTSYLTFSFLVTNMQFTFSDLMN